jgi:carbon-monoxide dehydrogenase medium subunit
MEYSAAKSIEEALRELVAGMRPVAGGTDLAVVIADGLASPRALVDVSGIPQMRGIRLTAAGLAIGAATTIAEIARRTDLPACLSQGALAIGSPQIRTLATIGGNVCNASPCGDTLAPLVALDARFIIASASGSREVGADSFFLGPKKTGIRAEELLVEIRIPAARLAGGSSFRMIGKRKGQAISQVNTAVWVRIEGGRIAEAGAAVGSVAPVPLRLRRTEGLLRGARAGALDMARVLAEVDAEISPISDVRASVEYRRLVTAALFRDCLEEALGAGEARHAS